MELQCDPVDGGFTLLPGTFGKPVYNSYNQPLRIIHSVLTLVNHNESVVLGYSEACPGYSEACPGYR